MTPINLPKDLEDWARAEVAAGRAASVDDLVARTLRDWRDVHEHHRVLVGEAYAQVERGEAINEDAADSFIDALIGAAERR